MGKHRMLLPRPRAAAAGQRWEGALVLWKEGKFSLGRRSNLMSGASPPDTTYREYVCTLAVFSPILRSLLVLQVGHTQPEARGHWSLVT